MSGRVHLSGTARLRRAAVLRRKRRLRAAMYGECGRPARAISSPAGSRADETSALPDPPLDLDSRMMRRAIALAKEAAAMGEVPIGAVVYRGDEIIAEAHNNRETNADPTGHAELLALRMAGTKLGHWRLLGCAMAVTLEPCPMCAGALVNARVERLVYGADDPKAGAVSTLYEILTDARLNHRLEVKRGLFATECGALLSEFFRERRRMNRERSA